MMSLGPQDYDNKNGVQRLRVTIQNAFAAANPRILFISWHRSVTNCCDRCHVNIYT